MCGAVLAKGKLDFPAYAGAFVGMSSPLVLASLPEVALAGLLTGIIYEAVHGVFDGVGGRPRHHGRGSGAPYGAPLWRGVFVMLIPSVVSGVSAGLGGFALRKHWRLSSVQASAIVALVAGLSLPYVHGKDVLSSWHAPVHLTPVSFGRDHR